MTAKELAKKIGLIEKVVEKQKLAQKPNKGISSKSG